MCDFLIKTVDVNDNYSSGSEITIRPVLSDLVISPVQFIFDGKTIVSIPDGAEGKMSAEINVTNNNSEAFSGSLWLAVYENGILKSVVSSGTLTFTPGKGTKRVKAEVNITSDSTVKAFFIDNIQNMKLLCEETVIS